MALSYEEGQTHSYLQAQNDLICGNLLLGLSQFPPLKKLELVILFFLDLNLSAVVVSGSRYF